MKISRKLVLALGVVPSLLVVVVVLAFLPPIQKAVVLSFANRDPGVTVTAGRIAVGLHGAQLDDVQVGLPGLKFAFDSARVDASTIALARGASINLRSLEVKGLRIDLSSPDVTAPASAASGPLAPEGWLKLSSLLPPLVVGELTADGHIVLPPSAGLGDATFTLTAKGIQPGTDNRIDVRVMLPASTTAPGGEVAGAFQFTMQADGSCSEMALELQGDVQLSGARAPLPFVASTELRASDALEAWRLQVRTGGVPVPVLDAQGTFDPATQELAGSARIDATHATLAPLFDAGALAGTLSGDTTFSLHLTTLDWTARGALEARGTGLAQFGEHVAGLEPLTARVQFGANAAKGVRRVDLFDAAVAAQGGQPLFTARLAQPLTLATTGLPDRAALAPGPLAEVALRGMPAGLLRPFLPGVDGGAVTGLFALAVEGDGLVLSSGEGVHIPNLSVAIDGHPLLTPSDVTLRFAARADRAMQRATVDSFTAEIQRAGDALVRAELMHPLAIDLVAGRAVTPAEDADVARFALTNFPLPDLKPFVAGLSIAEPFPRVSGGLVLRATAQGWGAATSAPLSLTPATIALEDRLLLHAVTATADFAFSLDGDALHVSRAAVALRNDTAEIVSLEGSGEVTLSTAAVPRFSVQGSGDLVGVFAQPAARVRSSVTEGRFSFAAEGGFAPGLNAKGNVGLRDVRTPAIGELQAAFSGDFSVAAEGDGYRVTLPLHWNVGSRTSNLELGGHASQQGEDFVFEATARADFIDVEDLKRLSSAVRSAAGPASTTPDEKPFWAGFRGHAQTFVGRVFKSGMEVTQVSCDVTVTPDSLAVDNVKFQMGAGEMIAQFLMQFSGGGKTVNRYALEGSMQGRGIDSGNLFKATGRQGPPMLAARTDMNAKFSGSAPTLGELANQANTEVKITGTDGRTRLLAATSDTLGKIAQLSKGAAPLAGLIGRLTGGSTGRRLSDAAVLLQQAGEVAGFFAETPFDRFELEATAQGFNRFEVSNLLLQSPQLIVQGKGSGSVPPGGGLGQIAYQLQLAKFGASGTLANALKNLAPLAPAAEGDAFVYLAEPVALSGDFVQSDTRQLFTRLIGRALSPR